MSICKILSLLLFVLILLNISNVGIIESMRRRVRKSSTRSGRERHPAETLHRPSRAEIEAAQDAARAAAREARLEARAAKVPRHGR